MTSKDTSDIYWSERLFTLAVSAGAAGLVIFAFYLTTTLSLTGFLVLTASAVVAVLVSGFRCNIPGTRIQLYPSTVMAFWGAMWLGMAGAVLLAAVSGLGDRLRTGENDRRSVFSVACDIIAGFTAASIYHLALANFHFQTPEGFNDIQLVPNEVIIASILMAATHFGVVAALYLIRQIAGEAKKASDEIGMIARSYPISTAGTMLLYLVFRHFGIEFGLVIIPLVVLGNIAYRMHLRSLQQKTREITEASRLHLATVEALATAIDARDQVGTGHVRRTQIYAVGLGKILGLSEDEISALSTGALLHDIGKLAVPDHILNKPGRLTPAEMEKTKIHSSVGASILEKVGFTYPVVPTVKYHHECWDGSGYPERLKGSNIPITARILTIADAFDTLRGARPYRAAVSRDEACEFLRSRSGSQFDPALVEIFMRNLKVLEDKIDAAGLSYNATENSSRDETVTPTYEEQIQRANHEVFTLYSLAREFSGSLNLGETLEYFTGKVAEFVPYDTCIVYLVEDSGDFARAAYVAGDHRESLSGNRIKIGEGATGYVLNKRTHVENVDPALDFAFTQNEIGLDFRAMASLPLIAEEKLVGAISLYSRSLENYQDEHIRLLDTVSRIAADAIEKALRHAEVQVYALTDPMTGLPNSRSLQIEFDKEVMRAGRNATTFQLLVLDLDGFKSVNDTYGHKAGDEMLREVAKLIRSQLREYDFLARYGGDEFVAIVPETDMAFVEGLRHRIEDVVTSFKLPVGEGVFARIGISFGSASFPAQGENFDELIVAADRAMYRSKAVNRLRGTPFPAKAASHGVSEEFPEIALADVLADPKDMPVPRPIMTPLGDEPQVSPECADDPSIISLSTIT